MSLLNTIISHLFSEYSSQLPADGGAFYTADTMDMSKPHYKKAWPPILYAASLWLKETGFTNVDKDDSRPANMKADESDADRFHLLLGQYPTGFPLGLENLENLEKWEGIFQSGKSQGILNRLEKSGKITQNTGKLREFEMNII